MSTDRFSERLSSWRMVLASLDDIEGKRKIFDNAVKDIAGYVQRGFDRVKAVDELHNMAQAYGLIAHYGEDEIQAEIAAGFEEAERAREQVPDDWPAEQPRSNGHAKTESPAEPLPKVNIRLWQGVKPPPRRWVVQDRIPAKNVTLFSGEGGVGKTLLVQQLAVATVLAHPWLGLTLPEPGPVLFVTAEDDADEMHFRFEKIAEFYGATFDQLAERGPACGDLGGPRLRDGHCRQPRHRAADQAL